jgi:hypothetical protein
VSSSQLPALTKPAVVIDGAGDRYELLHVRMLYTVRRESGGQPFEIDDTAFRDLGLEVNGILLKSVGRDQT